MKRGKCDSALCRARSSLTVYLDKLIADAGWTFVDLERNTNIDLLRLTFGTPVKIYEIGKDKPITLTESRIITKELYEVLYELCETSE